MRLFDEDTLEGREQAQLWRWRWLQARWVGCSQVHAEILADLELDAGAVRELAARGCPPELIVDLLV